MLRTINEEYNISKELSETIRKWIIGVLENAKHWNIKAALIEDIRIYTEAEKIYSTTCKN